MRVLLLVHRTPYPPDKGDKIRSWRLLSALTEAHETDLVTLVDDPADFAHLGELLKRCSSAQMLPLRPSAAKLRCLAALPTATPFSVAHFAEPAAKAAVRFALKHRSPEVIALYSSQTAAWIPGDCRVPIVADLVDVDSEKWAQYGAEGRGPMSFVHRTEARRLRAYEAALARRAHRTILSTAREAALFRERVADVEVEVASNGVEIPGEAAPAAGREPGLMVFVGAMDYGANVEAATIGAREILPRVRARVPGARFRIVGRNPTAAVRALAESPGVEVTGAVADVAPHVRAATLSLVPLRVARGIQNKVLEAMAHGVAVVASPDVAASLGAGADAALATGSGPEDLAERAASLLEDPAAAAALGLRGREFVARTFRWDDYASRIRTLTLAAAGRDERETHRRRLPETVGAPRD